MWFKKILAVLLSLFCFTGASAEDFKKAEPSYKSMCVSYLYIAKEMRQRPLVEKFSRNPEYKNQLNLVGKDISQAQKNLLNNQFEACYYRALSAILLMKGLSNIQKAKNHKNPSAAR